MPQQLPIPGQHREKAKDHRDDHDKSLRQAQIAQRRQGAAGFISPNQRPHGDADGDDTWEQHQHEGKHRARQQGVCRPQQPEAHPACQRRSEPAVSGGQQDQRRITGIDKVIVCRGDHDHQGQPEEQLRHRVESFFMLFFRRNIGWMEALHILPYRLQISFRMNGKFCFCTSIRQPDAVVAGICNQFKVMCDDENRLFLSHLADQLCAPRQTFRVLSRRGLIQYDNGLFGEIRHHQCQTLHLPAGEREGMPVAAVPHIHAFQQRFRFCFKLRCHRMAVLQLVEDGAGEELELRLL